MEQQQKLAKRSANPPSAPSHARNGPGALNPIPDDQGPMADLPVPDGQGPMHAAMSHGMTDLPVPGDQAPMHGIMSHGMADVPDASMLPGLPSHPHVTRSLSSPPLAMGLAEEGMRPPEGVPAGQGLSRSSTESADLRKLLEELPDGSPDQQGPLEGHP